MKTAKPKKCTITCHENGKPTLHISLSQYNIDNLCLEKGRQPKDLFTIIIHRSGEF